MTQIELYNRGVRTVREFCRLNSLPQPNIKAVPKVKWVVNACAFYRPDVGPERKHTLPGHVAGINICIAECAYPAGEDLSRNWSWPGSMVDRTPFGVLVHECGHHVDWMLGTDKGRYWSDVCYRVKDASGEEGITSYAKTNTMEWFAEAMRLYIGNPSLLAALRPKTSGEIFRLGLKPLPFGMYHWRYQLGQDCPARVVQSLVNKGADPLPPQLEKKLWK